MFWLLVGYLFLFIFRPFEYWAELGTFHIERLYMLFLLAAVFLWGKKRYIPGGINRAVIAFFLALVLSSFFAIESSLAFQVLFNYFKLIIFYFILIYTIQDSKELKKFILAYLVIMALYMGKSAWEFFIHGRHIYRMGIPRMIGIDTLYGDANSFAASIAYSLPLLFAYMRSRVRSNILSLFLLFYALLAFVCIIFSGSRSGMATVILFVVLASFTFRSKFIGIILSCIVLLSAWTFMPDTYKSRFLTVFHKGISLTADASSQGRIFTLKMGIEMFKERPILGVGPGNFQKGYKLVGVDRGLSAHNMYGMLLGETGILGTTIFFFLLFQILTTHWTTKIRSANAKPEDHQFYELFSVASIQTILLLLFNGNFGGNLYRYNWLWIGAIGTLASFFLASEETETDKPNEDKLKLVPETTHLTGQCTAPTKDRHHPL